VFTINVFATNLALLGTVISTVIIFFVFAKMSFSYTQKRANKHYAKDKKPAPSIPVFNAISKIMFVTSMLLTVTSYWFTSTLYLTLYQHPIIQFIAVLLVLFGYLNLNNAFNKLGNNYSPSFDAYLPSKLITTGSYRVIRHPIYLFNLFVSFGLAVSSGSALVFVIAIVGLLFIIRIITIEEESLRKHFIDYQTYSKKSWRLVPFFY